MILTLIILAIAAALGIFVTRPAKCPYCGSKNLELKRVDATINFARWFAKCKDCGKDFYVK